MQKKYLVIGAVVLIIISIIVVAFTYNTNANSDTDMSATIYIKNVENGEVIKGDISLNGVSITEQMILSVGQDIRETEFSSVNVDPYNDDPTDEGPNIDTTVNYEIWVDVTVDAYWKGVTLNENKVIISGVTDNDKSLLYSNSLSSKILTLNDKILNNQTSIISMNSEGYSWNYYSGTNIPIQLTGADLDGIKISIDTKLSGVASNDDIITKTDSAEVTLNVDVITEDTAEISVSITDIDSGSVTDYIGSIFNDVLEVFSIRC
jgi:hypothetical protein